MPSYIFTCLWTGNLVRLFLREISTTKCTSKSGIVSVTVITIRGGFMGGTGGTFPPALTFDHFSKSAGNCLKRLNLERSYFLRGGGKGALPLPFKCLALAPKVPLFCPHTCPAIAPSHALPLSPHVASCLALAPIYPHVPRPCPNT